MQRKLQATSIDQRAASVIHPRRAASVAHLQSPPSIWHVACVVAKNGVHHRRHQLICHLVEVGPNRRVGGHACHVRLDQLQRSLQQDETITEVIRGGPLEAAEGVPPAMCTPLASAPCDAQGRVNSLKGAIDNILGTAATPVCISFNTNCSREAQRNGSAEQETQCLSAVAPTEGRPQLRSRHVRQGRPSAWALDLHAVSATCQSNMACRSRPCGQNLQHR